MEPLKDEDLNNIKNTFILHGLNHVINFGKYNGCTIKEIGEIDSDYLIWLDEEKIIKPNGEVKKLISKVIIENEEITKSFKESEFEAKTYLDKLFGL